MKKALLVTLLSSLVILCDYLTKRIVASRVMPHEAIEVLPFLRIVHVENVGAAFGLFSRFGNTAFIFISGIAIIFILIYMTKVTALPEVVGLSLILGGAAGNLLDRLIRGKVFDFIDFFVGRWHWPAFNLADSALSVGIVLFLWSNLRGKKSCIT